MIFALLGGRHWNAGSVMGAFLSSVEHDAFSDLDDFSRPDILQLASQEIQGEGRSLLHHLSHLHDLQVIYSSSLWKDNLTGLLFPHPAITNRLNTH